MAAPLIVAGALAAAAVVPVLGFEYASGFIFAGATVAATQKLPKFKLWSMAMVNKQKPAQERRNISSRRLEDRVMEMVQEVRELAIQADSAATKAADTIKDHLIECRDNYKFMRNLLIAVAGIVISALGTIAWALISQRLGLK